MEAQLYAGLLNDVWQALERLGLGGREDAEGARGWINAVSVDGARLRVLLRVTVTGHKGDRLLGEVGEVIRAIPALAGVEVLSRSYTGVGSEAPTSFAHSNDAVRGHAACVSRVLAQQPYHGWAIEGIQQRNADSSTATNIEHSVAMRVLIRAQLNTRGENEPRSSQNMTSVVSTDSFLH